MVFQTLRNDVKSVYYYNNQIIPSLPTNNDAILKTWNYDQSFRDRNDILCAFLYVNGSTILDLCLGEHREKIAQKRNKLKFHLKALNICKLNVTKIDWWNYIPKTVLTDYLVAKNEITKTIFVTVAKPLYYELLLNILKVIKEIEQITNSEGLPIKYNLFGTINCRLTTKKGSVPILTMSNENKKHITPTNDFFLSLDYNAYEPRVFLSYLNYFQFSEDFYEWIIKKTFPLFISMDREKNKKLFLSWLYSNSNKTFDAYFDKKQIFHEYYDGNSIKNIFGKSIECEYKKVINYLIASTAAYVFYEQTYKIFQLLKNKKTKIKFLIHDNIILDFAEEDHYIINDIVDMYKKTRLGIIPVNVKTGNNLGELKQFRKDF